MADENVFLLYALLMGIFISFLYDILRILRRVIPHADFMVSLEDILFWIYCAVRVFLLMYHESDGSLRWFAVLGALVGMSAYRKLVSPLLVKYVSLALKKVFQALGKVFAFLLRPIRALLRQVKKRVDAVKTKMAHRRRKHENQPKNRLWKKELTHLKKVLKMMLE